MPDLSTTYLGLPLESPIVPSSSPLMESIDNLKRMEDAGAPGVVLHSLFEEDIERESEDLDRYIDHGSESYAEAVNYFPDLRHPVRGAEQYLEHLRRAKAALSIPVIASLNGATTGGWIHYARHIEEAGADALELNMYYVAADFGRSSLDVERMYLDLLRNVERETSLPTAVKLGPHFTAFAHFASAMSRLGADGLVLFNRFYQPDIDLERLDVLPDLELSRPYELRLRLRWAAILSGRIASDIAVSGGVHWGTDVVKCMMAGAKVAMTTSSLLRLGIDHLRTMKSDLAHWMDDNGYESLAEMRGSMSQRAVAEPAAFERANYLRVLRGYRHAT